MAFLEKIPSWLRWILFLPLAIIAYYFVHVLVYVLVDTIIPPRGGLLWQIFPWTFAQGLATFVFVWVGAKVAPMAQFQISIKLAVLYSLFYGLVLGGSYLEPEITLDRTELIASFGAGLIGAVAACYLFYRNYKKGKPQDTEYEVIELHDLEE
jgi:hypothetical protein